MDVRAGSGLWVADSSASVPQLMSSPLVYSNVVPSSGSLKWYAEHTRAARTNLYGLYDYNSGVSLLLNGLYIHENTLFARLQLKNATNVNYDVEQLRFYIKDKKQGKRTATQELEIIPLMIDGDTATVRGNGKNTWVVAIPKFTIPDGKNLIIEVMEKDGGRHLGLKVKNRKLIKAKTI